MGLIRIAGGSVHLADARRGTAREVHLLPYWLSAVTVSAGDLEVGRFTGSAPAEHTIPAVDVTWREAVAWCNAASECDGLRPAYVIGVEAVTWDPTSDGYRLPTEAEWVHGSRGGGAGARYGPLSRIAWTAEDAVSGPQRSALKDPNGFGLFDTLGNVWEWCWDRLDPARYGDYRVLKGGGWADPEWSCRVGVRRGNAPDARVEDVGFRVARGPVAVGDQLDGGQGWSERADRQRASLTGPLPVGWTPLA